MSAKLCFGLSMVVAAVAAGLLAGHLATLLPLGP